MKMSQALFAILCFSLIADAGVNSVGKGGGYGEMLAYHANENMQELVGYCNFFEGCTLSLEEKETVAKAASLKISIVVDSQCEGKSVQAISVEKIQVNACSLYLENANKEVVVLRFDRIAALILEGRLLALGMSLQQASSLSLRAIPEFKPSSQDAHLDLEAGRVTAHVLILSTPTSRIVVPSVEGKSITVSLQKQVEALLECELESVQGWTTLDLQVQVLNESEGLMELPLEWQCQSGKKWRAKAQIFFSVSKGEIDSSSLVIQLVQKKQN